MYLAGDQASLTWDEPARIYALTRWGPPPFSLTAVRPAHSDVASSMRGIALLTEARLRARVPAGSDGNGSAAARIACSRPFRDDLHVQATADPLPPGEAPSVTSLGTPRPARAPPPTLSAPPPAPLGAADERIRAMPFFPAGSVPRVTVPYAASVDPRAARTRERALAAARDLLDGEGWPALTHGRVSSMSGISRMTLYRHWPTSADLHIDTLRSVVDLRHITPTGDLRADLVAEMEVIRLHLFRPGRVRLFTGMLDRALRDPVFERLRSELMAEHCILLSDLLSTLSAGGPDGDDRPDPIERLLGPCLYRRLVSGRPVTGPFIEELVDSVLTEFGSDRPRS